MWILRVLQGIAVVVPTQGLDGAIDDFRSQQKRIGDDRQTKPLSIDHSDQIRWLVVAPKSVSGKWRAAQIFLSREKN